jgi:hypothetical protein
MSIFSISIIAFMTRCGLASSALSLLNKLDAVLAANLDNAIPIGAAGFTEFFGALAEKLFQT